MTEKTDLQLKLSQATYSRGIDAVNHVLQGTVDLNREALNRAAALPSGESFVLADIACGSGQWLHEMVEALPRHFESNGISKSVQGIGMDMNPLGTSSSEKVTILRGDATRMTPIADASVDIGTSFFGGHYIADMLSALESSHRILKPGGTFYWLMPLDLVSNPDISKVLSETPDAEKYFEIKKPDWNGTAPLIICRRSSNPEESFTGFPYHFLGGEEVGWNGFVEKWGLPGSLKRTNNTAYFRRGKYEKI